MELCKIYRKGNCPYFEPQCNGKETDDLNCVCSKFIAFKDAEDPDIIKRELKNLNITSTEKLGIMMQMQKSFAQRFHKIDGLSKCEIDKWTNDYLVCIEDELVEAMEYLNIYVTKIKDFNELEFKKELIDMLHFIMDGMLVSGMTYGDLCYTYCKYMGKDYENDFLDFIVNNEKIYTEMITEENRLLYLLDYVLRDIRLVRQCISWKHWKKPNDYIDKDKIYNAYMMMFRHLVQLFISCGMTSDDIYNIYVHKNIENILRQKYGYNK